MHQEPYDVTKGPINVAPDRVSGMRNARIRYRIGKQEMFVERADVPDLIQALQEAYGLK